MDFILNSGAQFHFSIEGLIKFRPGTCFSVLVQLRPLTFNFLMLGPARAGATEAAGKAGSAEGLKLSKLAFDMAIVNSGKWPFPFSRIGANPLINCKLVNLYAVYYKRMHF